MANCNEKSKWNCNTTLELDKEMYNLIWQVPDKADKINTYTKKEVDALLQNLPHIVVPTNLSEFTDDLGSSPVHTHSQYLTQHQSLDNYIQKNLITGLVKNDGTIDTNQYLTQHQDITGKVDKVVGGVSGNFAALNSSGNIVDSNKNSGSFANVTHTHTKSEITDFPVIPDVQIQSDWNQADNTAKDYIKNKPIEPFIIYAVGSTSGFDTTVSFTYYKDREFSTLLTLSDIDTAITQNRELVFKWYDNNVTPSLRLLIANSSSYVIGYSGGLLSKIYFTFTDGNDTVTVVIS